MAEHGSRQAPMSMSWFIEFEKPAANVQRQLCVIVTTPWHLGDTGAAAAAATNFWRAVQHS